MREILSLNSPKCQGSPLVLALRLCDCVDNVCLGLLRLVPNVSWFDMLIKEGDLWPILPCIYQTALCLTMWRTQGSKTYAPLSLLLHICSQPHSDILRWLVIILESGAAFKNSLFLKLLSLCLTSHYIFKGFTSELLIINGPQHCFGLSRKQKNK